MNKNIFRNESGAKDLTAAYAILAADRVRKYHNKKTVLDGMTFDSMKESCRYQELKLLLKAGEITDLRRQVTYELLPANGDERGVNYRADFVYQQEGKTVVEDVKGVRTRDYIIKRKLMKWQHPEITFLET